MLSQLWASVGDCPSTSMAFVFTLALHVEVFCVDPEEATDPLVALLHELAFTCSATCRPWPITSVFRFRIQPALASMACFHICIASGVNTSSHWLHPVS